MLILSTSIYFKVATTQHSCGAMASAVSIRQLSNIRGAANAQAHFSTTSRICSRSISCITNGTGFNKILLSHRNIDTVGVPRATSGISPANQSGDDDDDDDDEDGISLGTMKLPSDTDIPRFETLLFQWANSLCQGANLPLPLPLKVDKISGGVRLGFVTIEDGNTQVLVHIDCLVYPPTAAAPVPLFRAIRNGPLKDKSPPGEPRIMKSLVAALQKSVEIARV